MKIIFHIDVNSAFLSWTAIELINSGKNYDIRNSYAAIGGDESQRRGIILASSISCKKMGVKTGETIFEAKKKCPVIRMYPPNYSWYQKCSNKLFELLSKYTPDIEVASIDECYLDYTPIKHLYNNELEFAKMIQKEIYDELKFTVNIGIGNNKLTAKMASDFTKPYKIHTLYDYEIKDKMWPLDVNKLYGVGKKTTSKLRDLNINTIGDLALYDKEELYLYFKNVAYKMIDSANGISDNMVVVKADDPKGISNSTTLPIDLNNKIKVQEILYELVENVTLSLRKQKKYTSVVAVILKDKHFVSRSHQITLVNATNQTDIIFDITKKLLDEMWNDTAVRLVGIRLDHLRDTYNHQISLFDDIKKENNDKELEDIVDNLKDKYGITSISKATLINKKYKKKYLD